jgi:hypothetical protein
MYKVLQLISYFVYNNLVFIFMKVLVHWVNLMKIQNIQFFLSLEILKEKVTKQKIHFFNHSTKNIMFNEFKIFSF